MRVQAPGRYQSMLKGVLECDSWNDFVTTRSFGRCSLGGAARGWGVVAAPRGVEALLTFLSVQSSTQWVFYCEMVNGTMRR